MMFIVVTMMMVLVVLINGDNVNDGGDGSDGDTNADNHPWTQPELSFGDKEALYQIPTKQV